MRRQNLLQRTLCPIVLGVLWRANTFFAGEIVSQTRRKTPAMVAKIRPGAIFFETTVTKLAADASKVEAATSRAQHGISSP
jgi:hypothetical protein